MKADTQFSIKIIRNFKSQIISFQSYKYYSMAEAIYNNQVFKVKKEMCSRYTEFNNLELQSIQEIEFPEAVDISLEKGPAGETKEGMEENIQELGFYMKSSRNITNSYQISFQSNFMSEHESVFKRELQNYMEFIRIQIPKIDSTFLNQFPKGLYGLNTKKTCEELINEVSGLSNLLNNLEVFDKLKEFLDMVCNYCPKAIALELMEVANQVLQAYQEKADNFMSCSQLTEIGFEVASNFRSVCLLKLNCLEIVKCPEFKSKYSQFMKIYCATLILVIAQFFENPYNQQEEGNNGFKRPLSPASSEDEEEQKYEITPLKKRKFSF